MNTNLIEEWASLAQVIDSCFFNTNNNQKWDSLAKQYSKVLCVWINLLMAYAIDMLKKGAMYDLGGVC